MYFSIRISGWELKERAFRMDFQFLPAAADAQTGIARPVDRLDDDRVFDPLPRRRVAGGGEGVLGDHRDPLFPALVLEKALVARVGPGSVVDIARKAQVFRHDPHPVQVEFAHARKYGVDPLGPAPLLQKIRIRGADHPEIVRGLLDGRSLRGSIVGDGDMPAAPLRLGNELFAGKGRPEHQEFFHQIRLHFSR